MKYKRKRKNNFSSNIFYKGNEYKQLDAQLCVNVFGRNRRFLLSKGLSPVFSAVFLVLIFVIAASVVINIGMPAIDEALKAARFNDAFNTMKFIDNAIREVAMEGKGAKRLIKFPSPGDFEIIRNEDAVQFEMQGPHIIEYLSRRFIGNIAQIAGNDVRCSDAANLTMENSFLRADFKKVPETTPLSAIYTNETILAIREKASGTTVTAANSSIVINGDASTSSGTGFSEILRAGSDLPLCTVHVFVNSTVDYDIYYILFAGADFIVTDIRNVH